MGGRFDVFLNDATPIGGAEQLQGIRLTAGDAALIPRQLIASTEQYTGKPFEPRTESDWVHEIISGQDALLGLDYPGELWFFVTSDWSVYSNLGTLEPWWKLGNLIVDGPWAVLSAFRNDTPVALEAGRELMLHEAAGTFGDPSGQRLYLSRTDLHQLWLELYSRKRSSGLAAG
jgi:hypothetical protein